MKYKENDKVTIQSQEWYEQNKQPNGFIIYKGDGNKVVTFSPGMLKFCGQTFTVGKVITGSSIYPDHYTFIEDGGSYKWTDEMIAGLADANEQTYTRDSAQTTASQKPAPKQVEKPVQKQVEKPKDEKKPEPKPEPKPVDKTKPTASTKTVNIGGPVEPAPEPAQEPTKEQVLKQVDVKGENLIDKSQAETQTQKLEPMESQDTNWNDAPEQEETEISAFETFTLLLKPRRGAAFNDCATQAFKIMAANDMFPSASFDFNGFEVSISRK